VSANWKTLLMDCSTILCTTAFVITLLNGSPILCTTFAIAALASGVSAFYMRRVSLLTDLETTAQGLKISKEKLEQIASGFEKENNRLVANNRELQRNNELFRTNNQTLTETNTRLTRQVTELTLQITQLRESTERIRSEVQRFQQENGNLHLNVRALDQQLLNSRTLCEQISTQLASQQQGLGAQLEQLKRYLIELSADNRVHEKIQQLATLQSQVSQATDRLHSIQLQYAQELARFQTVHDALVQIRNQFDTAISEARSNNQVLRSHVDALSLERQRIHELLNQYRSSSGG
jgi:chromosome segregation ATPase